MPKMSTVLGMNNPYKEGIVGIEIETETKNGYHYLDEVMKYWGVHPDGSLRNNGVEYVLREPLNPFGKEYKAALDAFAAQAKATKFIDSTYTSVHVHLNMLEKEVRNVFNFFTLYFIFEDVLGEYCGADRDGNLFCLKTSKAEATYRLVRDFAKSVDDGSVNTWVHRNLEANRAKYSGLNIVPLRTQGSAEVRTHAGCNDTNLIDRWVKILMMLYSKADTFLNPVEIVNRLQGYHSKRKFLDSIFEDYAGYLTHDNLDDKMKDGIWYATSVAASIDNWKDFGNKYKSAKKVLKKPATRFVEAPARPMNMVLDDPVLVEEAAQAPRTAEEQQRAINEYLNRFRTRPAQPATNLTATDYEWFPTTTTTTGGR